MPSPSFNGLGKQLHAMFKDKQPAVFRPQDGDAQSIDVIFHDRHQEVDKDGKPYGAPKPVAWILTDLGLDPKFNDRLDVNGDEYIIKEIKPDGLEITELTLVEV